MLSRVSYWQVLLRMRYFLSSRSSPLNEVKTQVNDVTKVGVLIEIGKKKFGMQREEPL